jgi:hypothetical protein
MIWGDTVGTTATQPRPNRTLTVAFPEEAPSCRLLPDGQALGACVLAFVLALGLQLTPTATWRGGGGLTRHSHAVRGRLGGLTSWRLPCPQCQAGCTGLPPGGLRERSLRPEVARAGLLATQGGRSGELWAGLGPRAPLTLSRLVWAGGHQRWGGEVTRGGWPRPGSCLAAEKPSRCLSDPVALPTLVPGRGLWPLGSTPAARAAALPEASQACQRAAVPQEPS